MSDLNFSNRKDPKLLAAAVLIGLVLVAGIVLIGVRLLNGDDDASPQHPQTTATDKKPDSSSACGLPDGDQTVPTSGPVASWKIVGSTALPQNKSLGPAAIDGDIRSCFARSPSGSLFAAAWIFMMLNEEKYSTDKLARSRILPSAELEKLLATPEGSSHIPAQIEGFRVEDYSGIRSTVSVVVRLTSGPNNGQLLQSVMTMIWDHGDWKWKLSPDIVAGNSLPSMSGFVAWSGVS